MTSSTRSELGEITLIVEPNPDGHRLYYVSLLLDWCRSQDRRVVVLTTRDAVESAQWEVHLSAHDPEIIVDEPFRFTAAHLAQVATDIGASLTVLADGDQYLWSILRGGWRNTGELSLLVMRADGQPGDLPFIRQAKGIAKKVLAWSTGLRPRVKVAVLRSPLVRRRGPLRWAADPVTLRCGPEHQYKIREQLGGYDVRYWIGVFGVITPRKNLPMILESIMDQPDVGLVIAGSLDEEVETAIAPLIGEFTAAGGQVLILPGTLTDAEFDGAISVVDCVVAAHSNEGPSGVVLKAAASGRRLVLAGAKSLKRDAEYLGEQASWSSLDANALNRAIRQAKFLPPPGTAVALGTEGFAAILT